MTGTVMTATKMAGHGIPMESLTNAICMRVNRTMKVVRVWGL